MTLSSHVAQEGQTLQAVCNVTSDSEESLMLIWFRKVPGDKQDVEISTNEHPNDAFKISGRYVATLVPSAQGDGHVVSFTLTISS